jgi:hypothetical protein
VRRKGGLEELEDLSEGIKEKRSEKGYGIDDAR